MARFIAAFLFGLMVCFPAFAGDKPVTHLYGVCERECARFGLADGSVFSQPVAILKKDPKGGFTLNNLRKFEVLGVNWIEGAVELYGDENGFAIYGNRVREGKNQQYALCWNLPAHSPLCNGFNTFFWFYPVPGSGNLTVVNNHEGHGPMWSR